MFCLKCGEAIPDNSSFCPFCGSKVYEYENSEKAVVYATLTSEDTKKTNFISANKISKIKNKKIIYGSAIIMCILAVVLMVFGYKAITNPSYKNAVDNREYYEAQMKETDSLANIYGRTGILGGGYANISSSWENMLEKAQIRIFIARVKAAIGFGIGIPLFILGGLILIMEKRKTAMVKITTQTTNSKNTYNTNLHKNKKYSIIAALCLTILNAGGIIRVFSSIINESSYDSSFQTVILYIATIAFIVLLFIGKKSIGFLITNGIIILIFMQNIFEMILTGCRFEFIITNLLQSAAYISLFILFLFGVIDVLYIKYKAIKYLWFVPAVVNLIYLAAECIQFYYFNYISSIWFLLLLEFLNVIALFFIGLWVKDINKISEKTEDTLTYFKNI